MFNVFFCGIPVHRYSGIPLKGFLGGVIGFDGLSDDGAGGITFGKVLGLGFDDAGDVAGGES